MPFSISKGKTFLGSKIDFKGIIHLSYPVIICFAFIPAIKAITNRSANQKALIQVMWNPNVRENKLYEVPGARSSIGLGLFPIVQCGLFSNNYLIWPSSDEVGLPECFSAGNLANHSYTVLSSKTNHQLKLHIWLWLPVGHSSLRKQK